MDKTTGRHRCRHAHAHRRLPGRALARHRAATRRGRHCRRASRAAASLPRTCRKSSWAACCPRAWARRRRARRRSAPAFPQGVPTTTINKMCGSGMKAIMMAADQIRAGDVAHRGGRRSRVHEQRALSTAQGARRHAHGPRRGARPHVLRRPAEPVRRPAHGRVRREHGAEIRLLARRSGRLRHRIHAARAEGGRHAAPSPPRSRRSRSRAARARPWSTRDETPFTVDLAKIRDAEARVPQGRHGDRGFLVLDFRRRRRRRADVGRRGRSAAASSHWHASSATRASRASRSGSPPRPRGAIQKLLAQLGWKAGGCCISTRSTKPSRS